MAKASSTSTSRLSPLAQPFTFDHHPLHPNASLPHCQALTAADAHDYFPHHSDFSYHQPNSYSPHFPSPPENELLLNNLEFQPTPLGESSSGLAQARSFSGFGDGLSYGNPTTITDHHHGSLHFQEKNGGESMATSNSLNHVNPASDGSKHFGETSYSLPGKCNGIMEKIDAEFLTLQPADSNATSFSPLNKSFLGYSQANIMESNVLTNAKDKDVCPEKILVDRDKERNNGELVMAKSELRITCPGVPDGITLEPHVAESSIPVENSNDEDDPELDSPCWKGTLATQSTVKYSGPESSQHFKNATTTYNSLNPLAPLFFPRSAKRNSDYCENECDGNDSSSFQKSAFSAVTLSSRERGLTDSVKAGIFPSEMSGAIRIQCSDDIHEPANENVLPNDSTCHSLVDSSCNVEPYRAEDYFTSNDQFVPGTNVGGSVKGINDTASDGSTSLSFHVTENDWSSSSSGFGIYFDFNETIRGALKSAAPKIDVKLIVNAMHDLSELLIQNCSNDRDALNEQQHDIVQNTINNLYLCTRNKVGNRAPMPESSHACTSYGPGKSAGGHRHPNMEFQLTRMKAMTVPHNQERRRSYSTVSREKLLDSCAWTSDESIEKGDEVPRVIERALKEHPHFQHEMHPQALLYRNLWLEAEAARFLMKRKACELRLKTEMGGFKTDRR